MPNNRFLKKISLVVVLLLLLVNFPSSVPDNSHDLASHYALQYFQQHGYELGYRIIQNVGILGTTAYPETYSGYQYLYFFAIYLLLLVIFCQLVVHLCRNFRMWQKLAFCTLLVLYTNPDVITYVFCYISGFYVLYEKRIHDKYTLPIAVCCSVNALSKSIYLWYFLIFLTIVLISNLKFRTKVIFFVSSAGSIALSYLLLGYNPLHFFVYIRQSFYFGAGYSETMVLNANLLSELIAISLFVSLIVMNCATVLQSYNSGLFLLLSSFVAFAVYKHSTVRFDEHISVLIEYSQIIPLFFYFYVSNVKYCVSKNTNCNCTPAVDPA